MAPIEEGGFTFMPDTRRVAGSSTRRAPSGTARARFREPHGHTGPVSETDALAEVRAMRARIARPDRSSVLVPSTTSIEARRPGNGGAAIGPRSDADRRVRG